jgi:hypothetical protein
LWIERFRSQIFLRAFHGCIRSRGGGERHVRANVPTTFKNGSTRTCSDLAIWQFVAALSLARRALVRVLDVQECRLEKIFFIFYYARHSQLRTRSRSLQVSKRSRTLSGRTSNRVENSILPQQTMLGFAQHVVLFAQLCAFAFSFSPHYIPRRSEKLLRESLHAKSLASSAANHFS